MKKISALLLSGLFVFSSISNIFAIDILVNNQSVIMDVKPVLIEGRTLVPVAAITQALNGEVHWDPSTKTVTITRNLDIIMLQLENNTAIVNGEHIILDVPAQAIDNRTMVPVGFIAQAFGEKVEWDSSARTVLINSNPVINQTPLENSNIINPPISLHNSQTIDQTKDGTWIKGNKNSMIFHIPGGRDYNKLSPQNIVWFETAADAIAAGFRQAQQ